MVTVISIMCRNDDVSIQILEEAEIHGFLFSKYKLRLYLNATEIIAIGYSNLPIIGTNTKINQKRLSFGSLIYVHIHTYWREINYREEVKGK